MTKVSRQQLAKTVVGLAEKRGWKSVAPALAQHLIDSKRTGEMELLIEDIKTAQLEQTGRLETKVTSARPLSSANAEDIETIMKDLTGATEVVINQHTDETLLGGMIARTPDAELDLSLRTKINNLLDQE